MSKTVNISYIIVKMPDKIEVDGVLYPRTQWNVNVVREYWDTGDEKILDKLSNVVLDLS